MGHTAWAGVPQECPALVCLPLSLSPLQDPCWESQACEGCAHCSGFAHDALQEDPPFSPGRSLLPNSSIPAREDQKVVNVLFSQPSFPFQRGKVPAWQCCCSNLPLCQQLSPGWLISRTGWERLNSEHQPRGGREQTAAPAKSAPETPTALLLPRGQISTQIPRLFAPAGRNLANPLIACEEGGLPGAADPEGHDKTQQQRSRRGEQSPEQQLNPDPGGWRVPRAPTQKQAVRSTQHSNNCKNSSREKLWFRKPSGCIIAPPPLVHLALPGKGPGSITGGSAASWGALQHGGELDSITGSSTVLPPPLLFPLTKYLFNEGIPIARMWALVLRGAWLPTASSDVGNLWRRLRAPQCTYTRPGARAMATCNGAKAVCQGIEAAGLCWMERAGRADVHEHPL